MRIIVVILLLLLPISGARAMRSCVESLREALLVEIASSASSLGLFKTIENLRAQMQHELASWGDDGWEVCINLDELCQLENQVADRLQNHLNALPKTEVRVTAANFRGESFYALQVSGVLNDQSLPDNFYVLIYSSEQLPARDVTYQFGFRTMHEAGYGVEYFGFVALKPDELGLAFVRLPSSLELLAGTSSNLISMLSVVGEGSRAQLILLRPSLDEAFDRIDDAGCYEFQWNIYVDGAGRPVFIPDTFDTRLNRSSLLEERKALLYPGTSE